MSLYKLDDDELEFHVVIWDEKRQTLARTLSANVGVGLAIAAYEHAVQEYTQHGEQILLKIGSRVIRDNKRADVKA